MNFVSLKSYAKINIGLHILKKREDEYHEIETIMQMIDLCDDLTLRDSDGGIEISTSNPELPTDETNLCYQATKKLLGVLGLKKGVKIEIEKRIPISAGLGGGSSNASFTLIGLNKLWNLGLNYLELVEVAKELGSDVPFFLGNPTAYAHGRGELVENFKLNTNYYIVLVYPEIHISTAWVYKNFNLSLTKIQKFAKLKDLGNLPIPEWKDYFSNDLETVVFASYSKIEDIKSKFYELGADFSSMSGSGSAVFGIYKDERLAHRVFDFFKDKYKTFLTRPLSI